MQLCKLLSEMPIDLHKLVANYLRKMRTSQYLKAISWGGNSSVKVIQTCATGAMSWEGVGGRGRGWGGGEERGNSNVKAI